jgi:hypothetical protein
MAFLLLKAISYQLAAISSDKERVPTPWRQPELITILLEPIAKLPFTGICHPECS